MTVAASARAESPRHRVVFHDELNEAVRGAVRALDPTTVGSAFVAALRPRRFEHWSSLASFALASALPQHAFEPVSGQWNCGICGAYERLDAFDSNAFATLRSGGCVRSDSLRYASYDLERFANESAFEPEREDRAFFEAALLRIAGLTPDSRTFAAEKALGMIFPSRLDRKMFLGVLGVCGVLAPPSHPGLWPKFVAYRERAYFDARPYMYPVTWWRRSFGIDGNALRAFGLDAFVSKEILARLDGAVA